MSNQAQSNGWTSNFILILSKENFKLMEDQKNSLARRFRPKKILTKATEGKTKIFYKTCESSIQSSTVEEYAKKLIGDEQLIQLFLINLNLLV